VSARVSGILLHPTSLPGPPGIGDLGPAARRFVDFLARAGQRRWQILPLGPTGHGDSPYACHASCAGNPLLISPEVLVAEGYLAPDAPGAPDLPPGRVDYPAVHRYKALLLARAFDRFERRPPAGAEAAFRDFCAGAADWLEDHALFTALKAHFGGAPWHVWEPGLKGRRPAVLAEWRAKLAREVEQARFQQFLFFTQWRAIRTYANARGVAIVGDVPIFVPHDSADVWAHPELFKLDGDGMPTVVAGVPPDYFSATGQLWGNPVYRWEVHAETGFAWWVRRIRAALEEADYLRLDHFRGFAAHWEVPAGAPDAIGGCWVPGPGTDLFEALDAALGHRGRLPLIAEDLGVITDDVVALRDGLGLPGMAVLQFAFDGADDNPHLPARHVPNQVVYTGTHDNDTAVGWFEALEPEARARVLEAIGGDGSAVHRDLMELALGSVAETAVVPLQDVLGLGGETRMNHPGRATGNWTWRALPAHLDGAVADALRAAAARHGRAAPAARDGAGAGG
jgi:4-alpha-glucanotransferase